MYLTGVDTRQLAVADSNTSLANVLVLSNAPGATTAEANSRFAAFNQIRTFDNGFKLIKAASDFGQVRLATDNCTEFSNSGPDNCISKHKPGPSTKTSGFVD